ncbi:hypothetical protein FORC82_1479 [Escherichia coli]|nr:hypothetical protein FORC82_1479 [Escherichia coli]
MSMAPFMIPARRYVVPDIIIYVEEGCAIRRLSSDMRSSMWSAAGDGNPMDHLQCKLYMHTALLIGGVNQCMQQKTRAFYD